MTPAHFPKKIFHLYWGKQKQLGPGVRTFHLLPYHCLDVAAVAYRFLQTRQRLCHDMATFLGLDTNTFIQWVALSVALHDLGKFSSAFQGLTAPIDPDFSPKSKYPYNAREAHHDRLGYFFWEGLDKDFLRTVIDETGSPREDRAAIAALTVLMECSLGHHGKPIDRLPLTKTYTEPHNQEATAAFFKEASALFQLRLPKSLLADKGFKTRLQQLSWLLAGIIVFADWLGSNTDFFPYESSILSLEHYWCRALAQADQALQATEMSRPPSVTPPRSFEHSFNFTPTPLQAWAATVELDNSPQLFILEDVTGAGKTEAALFLTHRLLQQGAADGFYFGLPTMATSNAMFSRVADYYLRMLSHADGSAPSIVLAHAARDMHPAFREARMPVGEKDGAYAPQDDTATIQCNQWLADSRKKALLAPVGVGTIDQALLAALPRKHQSLRVLGLSRKVLIFDEVHAADSYMFELLEGLLTLHLHQGGSAILLTATLPQQQRERLINIWLRGAQAQPYNVQSREFPLATSVNVSKEQSVIEQALPSRAGVGRNVAVHFLHDSSACIQHILQAVKAGQSVAWIRNTVADATDAYRQLQALLPNPEQLTLFHSRFMLADRQQIEKKVVSSLGKHSTPTERQGRVIVATQVFQESLDVDVDIMLSDLCPIDDLIQRAGRLHRHPRDANGFYTPGKPDARPPAVLWVYAPAWTDMPTENWLKPDFSGTQAVYRSPGKLWLGMKKLRELGGLHLPEEARALIEAVYGDDAYERMPEPLQHVENQVIGEEKSKKAAGRSNVLAWQQGYTSSGRKIWFEDQLDISTRYSDAESANVVLLKKQGDSLVPWVQDGQFSWQLSTVRLPANTYAKKLAPLPDSDAEKWGRLLETHRHLSFLQPWLVGIDLNYAYDEKMGVHQANPQAIS